jgi:hypothetical protein
MCVYSPLQYYHTFAQPGEFFGKFHLSRKMHEVQFDSHFFNSDTLIGKLREISQ